MKKGYAGKINHSGSQKVEAPFTAPDKKGKSVVKKGDDLRVKKGK